MGHAAGDLLLQWAADRLRDALRPSDLLSRPVGLDGGDDAAASAELARLGGDEFTALMLDIEQPQDAMAVAQRIGQLMRRPFVIDGRDVTLTTSIGIALFPEDGNDSATLLKHADTAMYHAKNLGRDNAQVYRAALTQEIVQRIGLDTSLRLALERKELYLLYQPQIDVASGRVCSVEALVRWRHPVRGVVSPLEFIPMAEENGLIESIGAWVLQQACNDAAAWNDAGLAVTVTVNLSPRQFAKLDLADMVISTLACAGLAAHRLELEVTESALMENTATTRAALFALRQHGVRIALDDFGTGYSSLAYLARMPIGHIKVDKCFVASLFDGGESAAIVRAVLAMAHSLGMRVTAEGVETQAQAQALTALACDGLQGFHFSHPLPAHEMPAVLSRRWAAQAEAAPAAAHELLTLARPPRAA